MTMIRPLRSLAVVLAFMTVLPLVAAAPAVRSDSGAAASTYGPIEYDPTGNVIAIGSSTSATNEYVYDPNSRIVLAVVQRAGNAYQQSYTYDAYGNLLATNSAGGLLVRQVDPATNRLGSGAPLHAEYDAAGNLTAWIPPNQPSLRNYHYDAMNALMRESGTGLAGTAFVYHAYTAGDERFWTETVPPELSTKQPVVSYTIRDLGGQVLREYRSTVCAAPCDTLPVEREYAYRAGQLLGASTPTAKHYYTLDHLGTPRLVTDQARNLVAEHNYFPFGLEITDNAPTDGPLRFTGHERDADVLGHTAGMLDYMHARYYSAMAGRFLSVDPARASANMSEPQSWNRYLYALNNPILYVDATGEAPNKAGTTDPKVILKEVRQLQAQGLSKEQIFAELSARHGGNENRYFFTSKFGWVDVRHFGAAAALASSTGSVVTEALGTGNEIVQWSTEWGDDYRSGFSPEDEPSNAAGAEFGDDYLKQKGSAEAVLKKWMRDVGALADEAPSAHRERLPETDPSIRPKDGKKKRWWQWRR